MSTKFLNLEEIVKEWALKAYSDTATPSQKRLLQKEDKKKTKYLDSQIDWSKTRFTDSTKWSDLPDDTVVANDTTGHPQQQQQQQQQQRVQIVPGRSAIPKASILFETTFTNNTGTDQEYTMRTEKTTKSSMGTTVEKGLTRGFEMGLKLTTCDVVEANAGFKREVTLTNTEGETFEEELKWEVESVIRVKGGHVAHASLVVNERELSREFEIETRISGRVRVTFTNVKENNAFVKEVSNDIVKIVGKHLDKQTNQSLQLVRIEDSPEYRGVIATTTGSCRFRYGIRQEVKVNQYPIEAAEAQGN